ncbi:DUF1461 domain-containing protein [Arthrobacter sp. RIT-PI-e]|uniref:DUF1461 domain-containing protein n=1 Tax=Arthrobacter sp. RIT-PI-e TaxID=1681197 RepID=UPI000675F9E3|nr:DUF1461 domain-containing protein [Arthrobacter sp. RIT-PI-e]
MADSRSTPPAGPDEQVPETEPVTTGSSSTTAGSHGAGAGAPAAAGDAATPTPGGAVTAPPVPESDGGTAPAGPAGSSAAWGPVAGSPPDAAAADVASPRTGSAGDAPPAAPVPAPAGERPPTADPALYRDAARRAAVRDGVITARPPFSRFLQVVVALFFPVIVLAAAVRAVATSSFLWIEYNRPGFPADRFGFSLEDRMTYGSYALDYVLNFAPPRYLGDLTTPDGAPLFLGTEVGHMADVKGVLGVAFAVALVMFVLAVLACIHLARRYKGGIRRALFAGAVITLVGIAALAVLAVTAWETFFTQVHALFFPEGTWTFRVDDTLIRLFPEQFWTDSAVVVGLLVAVATLLTLVLTWPTRARRERSKRAQEAEQTRYLESLRST